ncbi:MAG: hypothetical protein CR986_01165 [Ignavibacteriae bacterium]|nr:MAG: hypothetical protein CR986_01165 [Ignavibacteriota bacterium]
MKKHTLSIVGIIIQFIGIGLMLSNINNEKQVYLWSGFPVIFIGLAIILVGLFFNRETKNKLSLFINKIMIENDIEFLKSSQKLKLKLRPN